MARALEPYRDHVLPDQFQRWLEFLRGRIRTIPCFTYTAGSPEGVIAGQQGDFYYDDVDNTYYFKSTNTGNTGWLPMAGGLVQADRIIAGDPGTEGSGITIAGTLYESSLKSSSLGGGNEAQFIMHRHSTTLGPLIVGARTNTNDETHSIILDDQDMLGLIGVGWDGTNYEIGAIIRMTVDGTPGANDMPGRITFWTTPNGSATALERMSIGNAGGVLVRQDSLGAIMQDWRHGVRALQLISPATASLGDPFIFATGNAIAINIDSAEAFLVDDAGDVFCRNELTVDDGIQVDASATAGDTRLLLWDVDNATLERVTVGAADSGGAGFKVLRIPN